MKQLTRSLHYLMDQYIGGVDYDDSQAMKFGQEKYKHIIQLIVIK
ncbi:MAG: hypothetical protein ACOX1M_04815 [Erysipelotrichaceae bacterium]